VKRSTLKLRAQMTRVIAAFLRSQARHIADQVVLARNQMPGARKAELSQDELDAVGEVLAEIDFSGWSILVGEVQPIYEEIARDGAYTALAAIHFDVEAAPGMAGVVNADALGFAQERAAELVGMKRLANGELVENPDAEWAITDATRDGLRQYVADSIEHGWSNGKLADAIENAYAFSGDRASLIARTETSIAQNKGTLSGYKASGVVEKKVWLTADDDLVDEEDCAPNGEQGAIGLDEDFQSGDDAPPAHPNCRCVLAPVVETQEAETETEEETTS
jgi:SPP1 gp7 family putative phage head morphogenesis protein